MPIMAPLADLVGLTRQTMVFAYQLCELDQPDPPDLRRDDGRPRDGEDPVGEVGALVPAAHADAHGPRVPPPRPAGADALGAVLDLPAGTPGGRKGRVDEPRPEASFLASPSLAAAASPPCRSRRRRPGRPRPRTTGRSRGRRRTTEMEAFLAERRRQGARSRSRSRGRAAGALDLFLVRRRTGRRRRVPEVLFYAQQHGDEVSGKDALLYLIRDVARDPALLPRDVDLWVMPMVNPDGAEAGTRKNGAGADLNRDHMTLEQPETQALHRVARRVPAAPRRRRPRVRARLGGVDAGAAGRSGPTSRWTGSDNPLFDAGARRRGAPALGRRGRRGRGEGGAPVPPLLGRGRPAGRRAAALGARRSTAVSTAIGAYGGLSFIIEAAVRRRARRTRPPTSGSGSTPTSSSSAASSPGAATGRGPRRRRGGAKASRSRRSSRPNYLWVNPGRHGDGVPRRRDRRRGRSLKVPTAEPDDDARREAERPDAGRLRRRRPRRRRRVRGRSSSGTASRSRCSRPRGRSRPRRARSCASRRSSTTSTAATEAGDRETRGGRRASDLAAGEPRRAARRGGRAARRAPPRAVVPLRPLPVPALPGARRGGRGAAGPRVVAGR